MNFKQIDIVSWDKFITRNLGIFPEMLGLAHEFQLGQSQIRIELPTSKDLPKDNAQYSRLTTFIYKEVDGNKVPTEFVVNSVDVLVWQGKKIKIPKQMLTRNLNAYEWLSDEQQRQLNNLSKTHGEIVSD
jgi:hypothetical protein